MQFVFRADSAWRLSPWCIPKHRYNRGKRCLRFELTEFGWHKLSTLNYIKKWLFLKKIMTIKCHYVLIQHSGTTGVLGVLAHKHVIQDYNTEPGLAAKVRCAQVHLAIQKIVTHKAAVSFCYYFCYYFCSICKLVCCIVDHINLDWMEQIDSDCLCFLAP